MRARRALVHLGVGSRAVRLAARHHVQHVLRRVDLHLLHARDIRAGRPRVLDLEPLRCAADEQVPHLHATPVADVTAAAYRCLACADISMPCPAVLCTWGKAVVPGAGCSSSESPAHAHARTQLVGY